jgi:Ni/Co efflux regulator RcnB
MSPRPKKDTGSSPPISGESIRGYARRTGVSYRQARKLVSGKVYERETVPTREFMLASGRKVSAAATTRGTQRAGRRKIRNKFWLDRWRAEFPQEHRSDSAILKSWRKQGLQLPRVGTHGAHKPSAKERARMDAFLTEFGMSPERRRGYLERGGVRGSDPFFTVDEDTGE